jgi:hypothetical protein
MLVPVWFAGEMVNKQVVTKLHKVRIKFHEVEFIGAARRSVNPGVDVFCAKRNLFSS